MIATIITNTTIITNRFYLFFTNARAAPPPSPDALCDPQRLPPLPAGLIFHLSAKIAEAKRPRVETLAKASDAVKETFNTRVPKASELAQTDCQRVTDMSDRYRLVHGMIQYVASPIGRLWPTLSLRILEKNTKLRKARSSLSVPESLVSAIVEQVRDRADIVRALVCSMVHMVTARALAEVGEPVPASSVSQRVIKRFSVSERWARSAPPQAGALGTAVLVCAFASPYSYPATE